MCQIGTWEYSTRSLHCGRRLEKSYTNDAFCIAGGTDQTRCKVLQIEQVRRNNRSLQIFMMRNTFVDVRNGKPVAGQELNCGRRTRNKNPNGEPAVLPR